MAESISDARVEEIFNLADEIVRAPARFTKDFVVQELGRGIAELAGAVERARKQLAAIADYRIEADSDYSGERWLYIVHKTDSSQIHDTRYSGAELEDELDGAALMQAIEAHQRGKGGDRG